MRLIALFEDNPAMAEIRATKQDEHFAFLERHRDEIEAAGGLMVKDLPGFVGGMWIFRDLDEDRAEALIRMDPYFRSGRSYRLLRWGKALPQWSCTI